MIELSGNAADHPHVPRAELDGFVRRKMPLRRNYEAYSVVFTLSNGRQRPRNQRLATVSWPWSCRSL